MRTVAIGIAAIAVLVGTPALAADMPVKAASATPVVFSNGFYVWADGSYQSVTLPTFDLGWRRLGAAGSTATESYDPKAKGAGVAGAIGYIFSTGPSVFGSNVRVEFGASYIDAKASQSGAGTFVAGSNNGIALLGRSTVSDAWSCGPPCGTTSTLKSNYTAWQLNAKAASDFQSGAFTFTPSVIVFAGNSRNAQDFSQFFFLDSGSLLADIYNAHSTLNWTDWGAKLAATGKYDVTNWLAFGLGGNIGFAGRNASLSANDAVTDVFFAIPNNTSSLNVSANTVPLLANAEASFVIKACATCAIRAFAGLNYDSRVPGISAPNFSSITFLGGPPQSTPSGIKFSSETSYYIGGGLTVTFNPGVGALASLR
jgi:hypothetical protein